MFFIGAILRCFIQNKTMSNLNCFSIFSTSKLCNRRWNDMEMNSFVKKLCLALLLIVFVDVSNSKSRSFKLTILWFVQVNLVFFGIQNFLAPMPLTASFSFTSNAMQKTRSKYAIHSPAVRLDTDTVILFAINSNCYQGNT